MRLKCITIILLFLSLSSIVHATSKLVCKLNPRKNEEQRHIWLLWIRKGEKDHNYISIEGRAYDKIPDWAKRINAIIESKAHRITFIVPTVTKEMEGILFCTGSGNRGNILTLRVAPKINNTGLIPKAYDCSKANYTKIGPQDKASRELLIHGVVRAPIQCPHEQTQVIIDGMVYNVTCQRKNFSYAAKENGCFHDDAKEAFIEGYDEKVFVDRLGYIVPNPAKITCGTTSTRQSVRNLIQRSIRGEHAIAALVQAITDTPLLDLSGIFSKTAVYNLIVGAEKCLCGKRFSGLLNYYLLYRRYAAPMSLLITATYALWTAILFTIAITLRIPLAKACRLICPSFRRFRDLKDLRNQEIEKTKLIKLQEDRALKSLPPENDYETILLNHFSEVYKSISLLNKKVQKLESKNRFLFDRLNAHNHRKYRAYLRNQESKPLPLLPNETENRTNHLNHDIANPVTKPARQISIRSLSVNDLSTEGYSLPVPFVGSQPRNLQTIALMQPPQSSQQEGTLSIIETNKDQEFTQ